ncbi:hypothetical protein [Clostridium sp. LP20]|uniref:hypothetical protein n=1 Tax=Clostridium sp. LP20 TaxID=3418665 RepID=UPI003EE66CA6
MGKEQLSKKDKEILKSNLSKTLKEYNKLPSSIQLSIDDDTEIKFENEMKDSEVIRKLVLDELDKDCPLNKDDIIYDTIFLAGKDMAANYSSFYWSAGGTYYYKLYVSKNEIIIYSLDNFYRVISSKRISISQLDFVGISNKDIDGLKLTQENLIMKVKADTNAQSSVYYFIPEKNSTNDELLKFNNLLVSNGVRNFIPNKLSAVAIITYIFMLFVIIFGILSVVNY